MVWASTVGSLTGDSNGVGEYWGIVMVWTSTVGRVTGG